MSNNITPIFGRLKNVTKENPYVAGAVDIKDDTKNKNQQIVNQETDDHLGEHDIHLRTHDTEIADRYTKEEVNNIVSRTPETDVIVIEVPAASQNNIAAWLDANTPSGTDPETGRSVRANKLYRVPGPSNTTFSEWAWDGTKYIMLANKDYGADDTLFENGTNITTSKAVYKAIGEPFNIVDTFIKPDGTSVYSAGGGWNSTDYIPVLPGSTIDITVETNYAAAVLAFYDKTKTFISSIVTDSHEQRVTYSNTITVPEGVAYIRSSAFLFGENLPHSLVIRQTSQILDKLKHQPVIGDVVLIERVIKNAKMVNYQIVQNQSDNWHINVIPATFSKFILSGSLSDGTWQDLVYSYDENLTDFSYFRSLWTETSMELTVPSTAKYILLTVNENAESPAKISIVDTTNPIKRSSIPYEETIYNAFVQPWGEIKILDDGRRYPWHIEKYKVEPFTKFRFFIPELDRTGAAAISFFSGEPSQATILDYYTTNNEEVVDLVAPKGTKYMLITNEVNAITFITIDCIDKNLESLSTANDVRLYEDLSDPKALRWGDSYPNFHIKIDGNEAAQVMIDAVHAEETIHIKDGFYISCDVVFEKIDLNAFKNLRLKLQALCYPNENTFSNLTLSYVEGDEDAIGSIKCYAENGDILKIFHIVTDGSNYLTNCFIENIKIEHLCPRRYSKYLDTILFNKRINFINVTNETFEPTESMVEYNDYLSNTTYKQSRQKDVILNNDHIVKKPLVFNGKTACFCGDSITAGYIDAYQHSPEYSYAKFFSDAVGLTHTNKGVGGATFSVVDDLPLIGTQVKSITDGQYDYIFIAGGVNDYSRDVDLDVFKTTLEDLCDWINTNLPSSTIIWITPINHAFAEGTGYLRNTKALWQYILVMTDVLIKKDTLHRYNIVKGHKFNFPVYGMDEDYIAAAFGDRLHPSLLGYQNIYAPGLLNALL